MDYVAIERLIKIINDSHLTELELEEAGLKIRMSKNIYSNRIENNTGVKETSIGNVPVIASQNMINDEINLIDKKEDNVATDKNSLDDCYIVKSPMVGTFYTAPSEEGEPFVKAGDKVVKGDILCIVEAMKLMNEIECDIDGVIVEILVSNGEIVEYGQPLIYVRNN